MRRKRNIKKRKIAIAKDLIKQELTKKIDKNDLNFIFNSTGCETDFSRANDPITFLNKIKSGKKK